MMNNDQSLSEWSDFDFLDDENEDFFFKEFTLLFFMSPRCT